MLSTFRRKYDPNWDVVTRASTTPTPRAPRVGDLEEAFVHGLMRPNRMMGDGRRLKEWTVGELRKEGRGMAALIERFADLDDDELVGDHLK